MNGTKETKGGGARVSTSANEQARERKKSEGGGWREDWTTLGEREVGSRIE